LVKNVVEWLCLLIDSQAEALTVYVSNMGPKCYTSVQLWCLSRNRDALARIKFVRNYTKERHNKHGLFAQTTGEANTKAESKKKELERAAGKDIKSQSTITGWYETKLKVAIDNARSPPKVTI
jgi:hypothetical protein